MGVANQDELDTEQQGNHETDDEGSEQEHQTEGGEGGEGGEGEGDEVVVQIGEEEPPASEDRKAAPEWVRELRERQRQLTRENAELRAKLSAGEPVNKPPELPPEPAMADFDFDEVEFKAAMHDWYAKKREVDAFEAQQQQAAEAQKKAVEQVHQNYAASKAALKVKDFQDAEDEVLAQFSQVQQSIVIAGAANPGAMVYALGKNPAKLKELASIKDPVKFAFAVSKLEDQVKVTKRQSSQKPAPETPLRSNTSGTTTTATLERLQAEADRTGDRTKVAAYLRQQRQAGK